MLRKRVQNTPTGTYGLTCGDVQTEHVYLLQLLVRRHKFVTEADRLKSDYKNTFRINLMFMNPCIVIQL